jgi:putative ABC transport system substrate-binding protein
MRRRKFVTLLSGVAAWPIVARAQSQTTPVIGYLGATALDSYANAQVAAYRQGLTDAGLLADRGPEIEFRWAEGHYDRLPALASELLNRGITLLFAGSLPSCLAAKRATSTIPIVFVMGADPVKLGVVASLNRPGGNVTGIYQYYGALGGKRLELIRELVPAMGILAVLSNPENPNAEDHLNDIQTAARAIGQQLDVLRASTENEIDIAFANLAQHRDSALLVADDPLFTFRHPQIVDLAGKNGIPAIYYQREFALAGGLMSYGSSNLDNYRQAGDYSGQILKGDRPADLPVKQPTRFELVINIKAAKALGLGVPPSLLARADEVIE